MSFETLKRPFIYWLQVAIPPLSLGGRASASGVLCDYSFRFDLSYTEFMDTSKTTSLFRKLIFIVTGLLFTAIAIIGVWVPGLPTTIFILLALWLFSNSSPRLANWILKIPMLGPATAQALRFQTEGTVALKAKIVSQVCAWTSFVLVSLLLQNLWVSIIVGLLAASCTVFMLVVPTAQRRTSPATID